MKHISGRSGRGQYRLDQLTVYQRDVVVRRRQGPEGHVGGGKRGSILALTRQSRARLVHCARNLESLPWFITLTYPARFPTNGRVVQRDWAAMRKRLVRAGVRGLRWLEFQ